MADTIAFGSITIQGPDVGTYRCMNLETLYSQEYRGEDRPVPGSAGTISNPRRFAPVKFTLQLIITGTTHAATRANIRALRTAVAPITTGTGTQLVTWTSDVVVTAQVHVGPLVVGKAIGPKAVRATLDLDIPAGAWT